MTLTLHTPCSPPSQAPHSDISGGLPTQCLFDTVIVPVPTWVFIITLAILPLLFRAPLALPAAATRAPAKRWVRLAVLVTYYFFVFVIILMETVEIARLATAQLGVALLPFVYVGSLLAAALVATDGARGRLRGWPLAALLFWVLSLCITAAKLAAVARFPTDGDLARNDSAYPVSHQITDLLILVIFYGLLIVVQTALLVVLPASKAVETQDTLEEIVEK